MPIRLDFSRKNIHSHFNRLFGGVVLRDLSAGRDAERMPGGEGVYWIVGNEPTLSCNKPLAAGWYMLEVELEASCARGIVSCCIRHDQEDAASVIYSLPMVMGHVAKRLIRVSGGSHLDVLLSLNDSSFQLKHFQLLRISRKFALSRLESKLTNNHPKYFGRSTFALSHDSLDQMWADYNDLFDSSFNTLVHYDDWINLVEKSQVICPRFNGQLSG